MNNNLKKLITLLLVSIFVTSCVSVSNISPDGVIISEITTYQTSLSKSDVAKFFCNNLTEYFNTYSYYRILSEIYYDKDKQNYDSTSKITKNTYLDGTIYHVVYLGSGGWYSISFSNNKFPESDRISTFRGGTVLGNALRDKVYDTFSAWMYRVEIALKANGNEILYMGDLTTAVEIERWRNSFLR
jgi:hypothetical protein